MKAGIASIIIISMFLVSAFAFIGLSSSKSSNDDQRNVARELATSLLYLYSDDGVPGTVITSSIAQNRVLIKNFPSMVIPENSDLVVEIWLGSAGVVTGMTITVGNIDGQHTMSGTPIVNKFNAKVDATKSAGWRSLRILDAHDSFTDGRVGVNVSVDSTFAASSYQVGVDVVAEAGDYRAWYWGEGAWSNKTTSGYRYFIRLMFIEKENPSTYHSLTQLQMGASLTTTGSYYSGANAYVFSENQVVDGNSNWTTTGWGWVTDNETDRYSLNLTFKNRVVVSIGDSITAGTPYHNPNPTVYASADKQTYSYQYRLGQLLGHQVTNKGIGSQTTALMLYRFQRDVLAYAPDYAIIMGGVNDISGGVAVATIEANLGAMYEKCLDNGTRVIALTILPDGNFNAAQKSNINTTNLWIKAQTSSMLTVVDAFEYLEDATNNGALAAAYDSGDHVHPSFAGYWRIANMTYQDAFASTTSTTTEYYIDKVVLEQTMSSWTASAVRPHDIKLTWDGGNATYSATNSSSVSFNIGRPLSSWLNLTVYSVWRSGGTIVYGGLGEIRIYGLVDSWSTNGTYANMGWANLTASSNLYLKNPYPRTADQTMKADGTAAYLNLSIGYADMDQTSIGGVALNWNASGSAVFTIYGLDWTSTFNVYQNDSLLTYANGPTLVFSETGGGVFEIIVSYPANISGLVSLIFVMLVLGIIVVVATNGTYPLRHPDKFNQAEMTSAMIRTAIYIVISVTLLAAIYTIFIG